MPITFSGGEQLRGPWERARGALIEELEQWEAQLNPLFDGRVNGLGNFTTNGFVTLVNGDGTIAIDTNTYVSTRTLANYAAAQVTMRTSDAAIVGTTLTNV